jgi:hypothetical protein
MYQTEVKCTYQYYDPDLRKMLPESECSQIHLDILGDKDDYDEDTADLLYRAELLQIFGIKEFDDDLINNEICRLYPLVKSYFKDFTMKLANQMLSEDEEVGFMMMFSYSTLFATHKCIGEIIKTKSISHDTFLFLIKVIEK